MRPETPATPEGGWTARKVPGRNQVPRYTLMAFGLGGYVGLLIWSASLPDHAANVVRGIAIGWFLFVGVAQAWMDNSPA